MWWQKWNDYVISDGSKLVQNEYKTIDDWVGNVIHWELYKRLRSGHINKCYMHKLESVHENKTHIILRDFEI